MPGLHSLYRSPWRAKSLAIVVGCFMIGAFGMTGIAYRAGLIGGTAHLSPLETFVARANEARAHQRWDEPPRDNVRDLTDEGLSRWPKEPKLVKIRQDACEDLVKAATAKHDEGDPDAAIHLARLAASLDPTSPDARNLVASWAPPEEKVIVASDVAGDMAVPPLAVARATPPSSFSPATASSGSSTARATLDASSAKPAVGQPVDFTAHVAGAGSTKPKVEGAHFRVSGPGLLNSQLDATDDGAGNFRTTFTFMQSGHFDVTFVAKADGAAVHIARSFVVGGADKTSAAAAPSAAPAQNPAATPAPPEPQPQPSAAPPANSGKFI